MIDVNQKNEWVETFYNGVKAVHTRRFYEIYKTNGHPQKQEEIIFYDKDGNRFYTNTDGMDSAKEIIDELALKGKKAIVGPKVPWRDNTPSGLIPNRSPEAVGIYIVKDSCENT